MRSLWLLGFLAGCALPVSDFGPVTTGTTAADTGTTAPITTATTSTSGTTTTVGTSASSICDPFVQDCPVGQRCDLYGPMTLCTLDLPDEPRIDVGKPCEYVQQCELGATCIWAATPACSDSGCCTPFCDLADPQAKCPLPGQQCLAPYDDQVQPGEEWLGVCRTETP